MSEDKLPMPADGRSSVANASDPDGVNSAADGAQGNAYPNPHSRKTERGEGGKLSSPLSHGGQSEIGYHGSSQSDDDDPTGDDVNAITRVD